MDLNPWVSSVSFPSTPVSSPAGHEEGRCPGALLPAPAQARPGQPLAAWLPSQLQSVACGVCTAMVTWLQTCPGNYMTHTWE